MTLSINIDLPVSAQGEIEQFLLDSTLEHLFLGPSVDNALTDRAVALILAQRSLVTLHLTRHITKQAIAILQQQRDAIRALKKLARMTVFVDASEGEVLSSLLGVASNLVDLHVTLSKIIDDGPWYPDQIIFDAVAQLK